MSVCRFSRPTSCRPCLTSAIALSYKILSGSAVFSAVVDLLSRFFLWRNCASHRVALRRNNPVINNSVERFTISMNGDRFAVAKNRVLRNLHLSLASTGSLSAACQSLGRFLTPPHFRTFNYTLNERPARTRNLPLRPGPVQPTPLWDAASPDFGLPSTSHQPGGFSTHRNTRLPFPSHSFLQSVYFIFIVAPRFHLDHLQKRSLPVGPDSLDVLPLLCPALTKSPPFSALPSIPLEQRSWNIFRVPAVLD